MRHALRSVMLSSVALRQSIIRFSHPVLLLALFAPIASSQAPDSARAPGSIPRLLAPLPGPSFPDSSLTAAATWPHWMGAPLVFLTPRYTVLAATPISEEWIAAHANSASLLDGCAGLVSDEELAASARPWSTFDSTAARAPLIMIQIMPVLRRGRPSCQGNRPPSPSLAMRGIVLQDRPAGEEYQYPRHARVTIGERAVEPVLYGRVPVEVLPARARGAASDTVPQLRLYLSPHELKPDSLGRLPRVRLRVWSDDSTSAVEFDLPTDVVHQLWIDFLPARLQRYASTAPSERRAPLPTPSDSALRVAWQRYSDGHTRDAALLTAARFHSAPLTRDDSLQGGVQLALSLLAIDDTLDAAPVIRGLMSDNPCLTLAASAPPGYAERFDRVRPQERCDVAVGRTIVKGLVLPGFGQLSVGRPVGGAFTIGSAVALTLAVKHYTASQDAYRSYQSNPNTDVAVVLYRRASRKRIAARNALVAGVGIWLLGAVEAGISEMHHRSEVQRVSDYGIKPTIRSEAGRTDFGLSLTF
jgi:hypothetical protein